MSANQCDGCAAGMEIVNGIHRDERGHPYMNCSADKYHAPAAPPDCFHPTAEAIINAVAQSFGVSDEVAHGWIIEAFSNQRRVA